MIVKVCIIIALMNSGFRVEISNLEYRLLIQKRFAFNIHRLIGKNRSESGVQKEVCILVSQLFPFLLNILDFLYVCLKPPESGKSFW